MCSSPTHDAVCLLPSVKFRHVRCTSLFVLPPQLNPAAAGPSVKELSAILGLLAGMWCRSCFRYVKVSIRACDLYYLLRPLLVSGNVDDTLTRVSIISTTCCVWNPGSATTSATTSTLPSQTVPRLRDRYRVSISVGAPINSRASGQQEDCRRKLGEAGTEVVLLPTGDTSG